MRHAVRDDTGVMAMGMLLGGRDMRGADVSGQRLSSGKAALFLMCYCMRTDIPTRPVLLPLNKRRSCWSSLLYTPKKSKVAPLEHRRPLLKSSHGFTTVLHCTQLIVGIGRTTVVVINYLPPWSRV